jgi:hypothetical protein
MVISIASSIYGSLPQAQAGAFIVQRNPAEIKSSLSQKKGARFQAAFQGINQAQAMKNSKDTTQITQFNPFNAFTGGGFNFANFQITSQGVNSAQVIMAAPEAPLIVIG